MKTMMKLMALVMAMLLVAGCLAACTFDNGNDNTTEPSGTNTTDPTNPSDPGETNPPDDGKKEYKVIVKNEDGTPVSGVWVQICKEGSTCFTPTATDENGCAAWSLDEASDYYGTVSALGDNLPKEYFGDGFEVTLIYNPSEA